MKYSTNAIYTYAAKKVKALDDGIYCASRVEPIPEQFPACFIEEISNIELSENVTLASDDSAWQSTFEVQIYSNKQDGALAEANRIMDTVSKAFKKMYFVRFYKTRLSSTDNTIVRLVARFRRVIGGEETMPTN